MWRPTRVVTTCGFAALLLVAGCRNQNAPIPNPLATADRVAPPGLQGGAGAAPPYYTPSAPPFGAAPTTFAPAAGASGVAPAPVAAPAPAFTPAPAFPPGPAPFSQPTTIAPGQAAPVYAPPAGGSGSRPIGGGSASRPLDRSQQLAGGDTVRVPVDAAALRFSSPPSAQAGPVSRVPSAASLASTPPRRATANGWIAGSAPVRPAADPGPRVRLPAAAREPVSVAAINRGVPIAPLEPAATGPRPGEPAPLRVASPASTTGWR